MAQRVPIDPDKGIPDLVSQLGQDSKRLLANEVRLAKLETRESVARAGRGAVWLGVAFGFVVVMLVSFTIFFTTLFGRIANGHMWVGAMLAAAVNFALGLWLVKRGMTELKEPPYTLPETRASLKLSREN